MTNLTDLIADVNEQEAMAYVKKALAEGQDPVDILNEARKGMNIVGQRFSEGQYFIPEMMFSGDILKSVVKLLEPHLKSTQSDTKNLGKVVIGTVAGDIHDIGKDLVVFMLEVSGFEVFDLGIDVPAQSFVDKVKETGATIVGLSGFLTLAFDAMKETIDSLKTADLSNPVKVMIGGGQIDEYVHKHTGADTYGETAMDAVKIAKEWIGG
jgi:methanogenic corrinoid protein MtbC1